MLANIDGPVGELNGMCIGKSRVIEQLSLTRSKTG